MHTHNAPLSGELTFRPGCRRHVYQIKRWLSVSRQLSGKPSQARGAAKSRVLHAATRVEPRTSVVVLTAGAGAGLLLKGGGRQQK